MACLEKPPGTRMVSLWGEGADVGSINDEYKVCECVCVCVCVCGCGCGYNHPSTLSHACALTRTERRVHMPYGTRIFTETLTPKP
jgi:hypothetical protein